MNPLLGPRRVEGNFFLLLTFQCSFAWLEFFWVHLPSNLGSSETSGCFVLLKLRLSKNVTTGDTRLHHHQGQNPRSPWIVAVPVLRHRGACLAPTQAETPALENFASLMVAKNLGVLLP